jgi:hypothetical protein
MERQIELAANHGLDGFIFDWYWYQGEKFLEKALESGFLGSANKNKMKFSLMWANHDWGSWPALTGVPGMGSKENQSGGPFLRIKHSTEDLLRVVEYCAENYFHHSNYWRVDGAPVFAIYDLAVLVGDLGGDDGVRKGVEIMRSRADELGCGGLRVLANIGCCDDNEYCCGWDRVEWAERMGFDAVFAYNIVRTPEYSLLPNNAPVVDYAEVIKSHEYCWSKIEGRGMPHLRSVTLGCDVAPRWHRGCEFPMDFKKLSYEPIVVNNTPERFGELLANSLESGAAESPWNAVIVNAWNEWTEDMYLLPEKRSGNAYLEAVAAITERISGIDRPRGC